VIIGGVQLPDRVVMSPMTLDSTAARSHGLRVEGLYALEESIFQEAGIGRPKEGRWDLTFQTFLLSLLLVFGLCLAGLTLVVFMSWNVHLNVDTGAPAAKLRVGKRTQPRRPIESAAAACALRMRHSLDRTFKDRR
jgi:hypothetical protein